MSQQCLNLDRPFSDAISKLRFAPRSNNLLISSWDSFLRLYDVGSSMLRLEVPSEAALLGCCFQEESVAFSIGSDCCIRRYDLCSGVQDRVGTHDDLATCVEYSEGTGQVITAGLDKKIMFWDSHMPNTVFSKVAIAEVECMSICGAHLLVAVGSNIEMYDFRRLEEPFQIKVSSMDYQISCIRSSPTLQGYAVGSIEGYVALRFLDTSLASRMDCVFRCHPKLKDGTCGKQRMVTVNDVEFHPSYSSFATGDNDGFAIIWDGQRRKLLFELPRCPSSVASLSFNRSGELLAIASSYTFQEGNEAEDVPQVFMHKMDDSVLKPLPFTD